jgi:hypothetical protein
MSQRRPSSALHDRSPCRLRPVATRIGTTTAEPYLPCPNREFCRRGGCHQPALDDMIRLCAGHLITYKLEAGGKGRKNQSSRSG